MTEEQVRRALSTIEAPDNDGYRVRVYLRGGRHIEGAIHIPVNGLVRVDGWVDELPAMIETTSIVAIERIAP
jgi:hypothetical protein